MSSTPEPSDLVRVRDRQTGYKRSIRADQTHLGDYEVLDEPAIDRLGDPLPVDTSGAPDAEYVPFEPSTATVDAVNEHLEQHAEDDAEVQRVLAAEATGQARKGVLDAHPEFLSSTTHPDGQPAEH